MSYTCAAAREHPGLRLVSDAGLWRHPPNQNCENLIAEEHPPSQGSASGPGKPHGPLEPPISQYCCFYNKTFIAEERPQARTVHAVRGALQIAGSILIYSLAFLSVKHESEGNYKTTIRQSIRQLNKYWKIKELSFN